MCNDCKSGSCKIGEANCSTTATTTDECNYTVVAYAAGFPYEEAIPVYSAPAFPPTSWWPPQEVQLEEEEDNEELEYLREEVRALRELNRILAETIKTLCQEKAALKNKCDCK